MASALGERFIAQGHRLLLSFSREPAKLAAMELKALREEDKMTPDLVFRDPYLLGFLGLKKPDLSKIYDLTILNRVLKSLNLNEAKGF